MAQQPEPGVYTFVAEWAVPRDQWDSFVANFEKTTKPALDRLAVNGTLISWGSFASVVHQPDAITHGIWFQANTIANIERAREELIKLPNPSLATATRHQDFFLRSIVRGSRSVSSSSGYLWVSSTQVKPGMGEEWREHWEKNTKPTYEELLKNGTINYYALDVEQVHTEAATWRFVVYITPNADGMDKVRAAFQAVTQKRSPEERRAISDRSAELTVAGVHRDFFSRVTSYWQK